MASKLKVLSANYIIRVVKARIVIKYRHCEGKLVVKVTDDKTVSDIFRISACSVHLLYVRFLLGEVIVISKTTFLEEVAGIFLGGGAKGAFCPS